MRSSSAVVCLFISLAVVLASSQTLRGNQLAASVKSQKWVTSALPWTGPWDAAAALKHAVQLFEDARKRQSWAEAGVAAQQIIASMHAEHTTMPVLQEPELEQAEDEVFEAFEVEEKLETAQVPEEQVFEDEADALEEELFEDAREEQFTEEANPEISPEM